MCRLRNERLRVAIVYTHLPHYRLAVFQELLRSDRYHFEFFYDDLGIDPTIRSGSLQGGWQSIRTYRVKSLMLQPGFLPLCLWGRFDIYIYLGNPYIVTTWLFVILARLRGKKTALWTHGWLRVERGPKWFFRKAFYRLPDMLLLYGNRSKAIALTEGFSADRMHVIYNSLDYEAQKSERQRLDAYERHVDRPFFLCVSRLVAEVELELAIDAISMIAREQSDDIALIVVGEGPLRKALEQKARNIGAPVVFLGAIYEEKRLAELFVDCLAVVSPGKVGLLAMHALAYGASVITHGDLDYQMPEVEAIIPGKTGQFFQRGSATDLCAAMKFYLSRERSEAHRRNAIETIESNFTPAVQRRLIEQALDNLSGRQKVR